MENGQYLAYTPNVLAHDTQNAVCQLVEDNQTAQIISASWQPRSLPNFEPIVYSHQQFEQQNYYNHIHQQDVERWQYYQQQSVNYEAQTTNNYAIEPHKPTPHNSQTYSTNLNNNNNVPYNQSAPVYLSLSPSTDPTPEGLVSMTHQQPPLSGVPKKTRKRSSRSKYSASQLELLKYEFRLDNFLSHASKIRICNQTNLTPYQVQVWFQNRRARKKCKRNRTSPPSCQSRSDT